MDIVKDIVKYFSLTIFAVLLIGSYLNRACDYTLVDNFQEEQARCIASALLAGLAITLGMGAVLTLITVYCRQSN